MKALTLYQPWAQLVALGAKRIETRSWRTGYTGPLAIHVSKRYPKDLQVLETMPFFREALYPGGNYSYPSLSLGCVIAVCRLVVGAPMRYQLSHGEIVDHPRIPPEGTAERAFGDYSPGRFMWFLEDVQRLPKPIPAKGALGLWEWDPEPEAEVTFLSLSNVSLWSRTSGFG